MQAGPGRIVAMIDVSFGRPRAPELFADPEFHRLEDTMAKVLHAA
jgi:NitT/TauT family transport system ATP-binding protein